MSNFSLNDINNNYKNNNLSNLSPLQMHEPDSYALSGKIMLSAIVILFAVVVFMIALHIYARWYMLRARRRINNRRRSRRQRASRIVFYVDPNAASSTANCGLGADVIKSLPLFVYSPLTHRDNIDCAVCLSEFEENEAGRVLPKCHHSFHTDCIDMWFHSHSTCPICRAPVEPVQPNDKISVVVEKPAGSSSDEGAGVNTTSLADRRKGLDLSGVKIEVPSRNESVSELRLSSPASLGFRSPGSRLQSLKRILSMSIRPGSVSPSSEIGTSCRTAGSELDIELGSNSESTPR